MMRDSVLLLKDPVTPLSTVFASMAILSRREAKSTQMDIEKMSYCIPSKDKRMEGQAMHRYEASAAEKYCGGDYTADRCICDN